MNTHVFKSTKTFTHSQGLSCCFRQWRADKSHCSFLHGYALEVRIVFRAKHLDERNWVLDFGDFKNLKSFLTMMFDHKTLVARDDPYLDEITALGALNVADVIVVEKVGCEAFAKMIFEEAQELYEDEEGRVVVESCEVREHGANSAIYCLSE